MPRCARAVSLTGYYHVFDRGNSKQIIFEDDSDRYRFLSDISDRFVRHEVAVLAWCLMDNHFHLMVDDPYDNLSKAMQCALTAYAKYFNRKTGRTGHLFDNRYSRVAVESDTQAVQLLDYIHLNPVKGALDSLEAYRWSSYKAYQLGYDPFDICKHSCKSVPNECECKKAPSVGEDAFGKFYVNARSLTRRVRGTCW